MSNEYQEYMQMLADNAARVRRTSPTGTIREAENPYKYQERANQARQFYSPTEETLARVTEGKADPGDISKMPQAVDNGRHQRAADSAALASWEIEKQMLAEREAGNVAG
jgi:hypothetical protein